MESESKIQFPQTYTCSSLPRTAVARMQAAEGLKGISFNIIGEDNGWVITETIVTNDKDFQKMNAKLVKLGVL